MNLIAPPEPRSRTRWGRIAALQVAGIAPAALFMLALVLRWLPPPDEDPSRAARQVVLWYAERMWTLWVLLIALPVAVLLVGLVSLVRERASRHEVEPYVRWAARRARLAVTAATVVSVAILAVVVVHMAMN